MCSLKDLIIDGPLNGTDYHGWREDGLRRTGLGIWMMQSREDICLAILLSQVTTKANLVKNRAHLAFYVG